MNQMKSLSFREKRKKSWKKLEFHLKRIENKGLESLSPKELMELAKLYRTACSSLYLARNISLDKNLHDYLENLVSRGYLTIYCTKPVRENALRNFFLRQFPQVFRKYFWYHFAAFVIFMVSLFATFMITANDSSYYHAFVPREMASGRTPFSSEKELKEVLHSGRDSKAGELSMFSAYLFTHNTKVGFLCFSLGIVAGLPTIYLLIRNGATLGAMSQIYHDHNLATSWWAWILPHGITEILAILLCAGAGLIIAAAALSPGKYGRLHQLKVWGKDAGLTVIGTVPLFFLAGLIEGFFRQTSLPDGPRYMVALLTLAFWIYYFGLLGREK